MLDGGLEGEKSVIKVAAAGELAGPLCPGGFQAFGAVGAGEHADEARYREIIPEGKGDHGGGEEVTRRHRLQAVFPVVGIGKFFVYRFWDREKQLVFAQGSGVAGALAEQSGAAAL